MTEELIEQLVKKQNTIITTLKKVGLIAITIATIPIAFFLPLILWVTMILVILDVIWIRRMDVEYEYSYFNGDLDIDKIMNKESRKRLFSVNIKEIDLLAPTGSQEMLGYDRLKVIDYSTCTPEVKTYEMVTSFKGEKVRIKFEPNDRMIKAMKDLAPRKVIF